MPIDKTKKDVYVWYSNATNVTGENLAKTLGFKHGSTRPTLSKTSLIVAWGAKTDEPTSLGGVPVLNHPDNIRNNRNKLAALELMKKAKVSVAPFCTENDPASMKKAGVKLPIIGRTKYHQGGKGFWNCPTMSHVDAAKQEGAFYFQNLIEIRDEFRLHIVGDKCIYAVKKVKRSVEEMEAAYIKHETDRQKALAEKNGDVLDENTMTTFLRRQAKKFAQDGANMLIRSNRLGWKFMHVETADKKLVDEAVKACKAVGLDFGAVDCCFSVDGIPYIIEINSGPGLEETSFGLWVNALQELINEKLGTEDKVSKSKIATGTKAMTKESLMNKLALAKEMVDVADENDTATLNKIFKRMFE